MQIPISINKSRLEKSINHNQSINPADPVILAQVVEHVHLAGARGHRLLTLAALAQHTLLGRAAKKKKMREREMEREKDGERETDRAEKEGEK